MQSTDRLPEAIRRRSFLSGASDLKRALLMGVSFASLPVFALIAGQTEAVAQAVAPGFNQTQLPRNDDSSSGAVTLPFQANFFGATYSNLYVNNNGNVTFSQASGNYTPVGLGADYRGAPIIAPFLTDIDTRNPASGITAYGTGTYAGRTAFGVTWPDVGYFPSMADKRNTFQLVMTDRSDTGSGNFDVYYNYNRIQFDAPSASETAAAVGYSAGTGAAGTYYELPGSRVSGSLIDGGPNALATGSNNGTAGQFLFPVRNGAVIFANLCTAGDNAASTTIANCGPNRSYNQRIFYQPTGNFTLNVLSNTTIATNNNGESAVLLMPTSGSDSASSNAVAVNVASNAAIRSATRAGIEIDAAGGSGPVTVNSSGAITGATAGIYAVSGSGAIAIANQGSASGALGIIARTSGRATITNAGSLIGGVGVAVSAGTATLTNSGTVTFGQVGLAAVATSGLAITNSGSVTSDANIPAALTPTNLSRLPQFAQDLDQTLRSVIPGGQQTLPTVGIAAAAQGTLTLDNTGVVTVTGPGYGIAAAAATVALSNSGQITAGNGVALAAASYGGPLSITNSGTILGQSGIIAGIAPGGRGTLSITNAATGNLIALSGYAIDTTQSGVAARIDNRGLLGGTVALSAGSSFTNSGLFGTSGTSSFGNGSITNTGAIGLVAASGSQDRIAATFGNVSTFTNAGTIDVRTAAAAGSLTIAGNYVGQQGTVLFNTSTQANTSDRLVITGNASGTTAVAVTNLTPGVAFSRSPTLIQVGGTVAPNAFTLASAQNFGTLEAVLIAEAGQQGSTVALGSVPTAVGLSGTTAVVAARSIASQGGAAVLDRMTQLRGNVQRAAANGGATPQALSYAADTQYAALVSKDPIAPNLVATPAPASNVKPAVWARAFGDLERRSGSSAMSLGGMSITRDLGYNQATGGILAGTDVVISGLTAPDDGLILGVMGGYTLAAVRLNQNAGRQDYDGGTVGAYATYLKGGFFSDVLFKSDILGLDITAPGIRQSTGLVNYNVLGNIGYRFDLPNALYIEPTAGLEYVATVFDRTPVMAAGTVPLQDGDALRGRIGARFGTEFVENNIRVEPSITGLVYDTFTESGTTATFGGGTRITGLTNVGKVRGEIQASINFLNLSTGLSGFLRADYRIGDDLVGGGGKAGLRYQW